ncbi:MAG: THUMP domain-containing protein [Candidatus Thermoplasmatota archaeon]
MVAGESGKYREDLKPHLLRYGEIGTKSSKIRKHFEDILIDNIERTFLSMNKEVITEKKGLGRIFAYTQNENSFLFSRIFGIVSYSRVKELSSDLKDIKEEAKKFAKDISGTFAVRARRTGQHDYGSQDVEDQVGSLILDENPDLEVDLDDPENEFRVEVRHDRAYVFRAIEEGPRGLPLSSQGKVAAYIEDRYDFLAAWMMMKRGARPYAFIKDKKWAYRLNRGDPNLKKIGVESFEEILSMETPKDVQAIVLGERLGDYSRKEYDMMTLRPLIGLTEDGIENIFATIERLEKKVL